MNLCDLMTTNIVSITPQTTISETARLMQKHNIGFMPVCQPAQNLVGIVTDRDIVTRTVANHRDAHITLVNDIMTQNVISASPNTTLKSAVDIMVRHQIRRLPIIEDHRLIGVVSLGDLVTKHQSQDEGMEILTKISKPAKPANVSN